MISKGIMMRTFNLLLVILSVALSSSGQQIVPKEDSSRFFERQYAVLENLGPIKNSDADIEIRFYIVPRRGTPYTVIYQVRYKNDVAERFRYSPDVRGAEYAGNIIREKYYRKKLESDTAKDNSLLATIRANELFNLPEQEFVIDSLRQQNIKVYSKTNNPYYKCSDCYETFNILEIKTGNQYRRFRLSDANAYYFLNPAIKAFYSYYVLHNLLIQQFPNWL